MLSRQWGVVMDFALLPPEINSARMYTGPGPGPMLAAAAAWDALAAQLHLTAASYGSVISGLTAGWQGPSSVAMAAASAPYTAWMTATAAQAEQTGNQARMAAAAYEAAFAATVPPPVIAANRAQLMALVATNFLGQNTAAIMATEAQYAEMWAQDAAAMYGYAGSSATASQVTPFNPAPQTTNPAGTAGQVAAVAQTTGTHAQTLPQLISAVPQSLQSLAAPSGTAAPAAAAADPASPLAWLLSLDQFLIGPLGPTSLYGIGGSPYLLGVAGYLVPQNGANLTSAAQRLERDRLKSGLGGGLGLETRVVGAEGGPGLSAGMGRAGLVGNLSVPQSWAAAAPAVRPVAVALPQTALPTAAAALAADGQGSLFSNVALSSLAGRAMVGTGGTAGRSLRVSGSPGSGGPATTATIIVIPADDAQE